MDPTVSAEILPLANQHFDQSGRTSELLNKYLRIFLE
jgi:hypothetical protein